jgi:hypothetical protein
MGHFLIVDMNVIEMFALLALATIPTGKWFGLDALFARRKAPRRRPRTRADQIRETLPRPVRTAY